MQLARDVTGISKIIWILLLLISFLLGAVFSYVYTMGFYAPSEFHLPEESFITIQSVEFDERDTHFFDVTVLNPSYSPSNVTIERIEARGTDDNIVNVITNTDPPIPYLLKRGQSQTFRATWNWANYTGIRLPYTDRPVEIRVFTADERGGILELKKPLTRLIITAFGFNQSISVNHFNVTLQNLGPETDVNITTFVIEGNRVPTDKVRAGARGLPYRLNRTDDPVKFQCFYNWTDLMGQGATIGVGTYEGYIAQETVPLPGPVFLNVSRTDFNATKPQQFNITVTNLANSSTYVEIDRVTVVVGEQAPINVTWTAIPSPILGTNESGLIVCTGWDWSKYANQPVKITVYTIQGFIVSKETQTPQIP